MRFEPVGRNTRIAVLGGGAWGTALAQAQCAAGNAVRLWLRDAEIAREIAATGRNSRYLPGIPLDPGLHVSSDPQEVLASADCILMAVPTQSLRLALSGIARHLPPRAPLVLCCKGIERGTGARPSQVAASIVPAAPVAMLSGPSFAVDVARGLPTAVTVAAPDAALAARLSHMLSSRQFRCYSSTDLAGVEAGGALKNVLAIAAGIVIGRQLGSSAQSALITRGFVELRRLAAALGADPETVMGLSGLGDLILTCGSEKSRNFAYGLALGRGDRLEGLPLAEGAATAGIAASIARRHGIDVPIIGAVARILDGEIAIETAIDELLNRPLRPEAE